MQVSRNLPNYPLFPEGCAVSIGNFDGVHVGHELIIKQVLMKAKRLKVPSVIILFEPQPREFFSKVLAPPRLMRLREKLEMLQKLGIDHVFCLRFDAKLANLSAQGFIEKFLVQGLHISYLAVGDDFRFGHDRQGDFGSLQQAGARFGFEVEHTKPVFINNERVSSTAIRKALVEGDFIKAEQLLGRRYCMSGHVIHGDKRGQQLGFPTANIPVKRLSSPLQGVFAVNVRGVEQKPLQGVANLGMRPTINGMRTLLEVHLFDFNADIYGRYIEVEFLQKIREEKRFDSLNALKEQISKDVAAAKSLF